MTELKIVATIQLKASHKDEVINALHTVVDSTRQEVGCVSYDLHQDTKDALKYTLLEVWRDQKAIDEHNESAHFKAFVAAIGGKIESLNVEIIQKVY